ncbi:MAG: hypothetical protein KY394_03575 [Actinobacteria bacterium]|nr:hypothetical protein [Actinomycetota bacterium]
MTATRSTPRRPRLFSMELLGFMDSPGMASSWSNAPEEEPVTGRHLHADSSRLLERAPAEVGRDLLGGDFRWSVLVALVLIGAGIAALGAWATQRPMADRAAAVAEVQASAADLRPAVAEMNTLNGGLVAPEVEIATVNDALSRADALARQLFTTSASLPRSETANRSRAAEASGNTLDATKLLREAYAYRSAVMPVLAEPVLETDPGLIEIDEAVRHFGAWQARFDATRTALPDDFMNKVTVELDSISAQLDSVLSDYVDGLRSEDPAAAADAVSTLSRRLATAETTLFSSLGDVQTRVQRHIDSALLSLDLLIS